MKNVAVSTPANAAADMEALDSLLEDLEIEGGEPEPIEEVVEASADEVIDDEALRALETSIARDEAYAEQETNIAEVDTSAPTPETNAKKTSKKAKASNGSAPATRTPRDLNSIAPEFFVLDADPAKLDQAALDQAKANAMLLTPKQKKVAEKFENLFQTISAGRKPSTYVVDAFQLLDSKSTVSMSDIIGAYKAKGYKQGTASSQAGQIMHLFDTVKIGTRTKSSITLNSNSTIAKRLRDILATA